MYILISDSAKMPFNGLLCRWDPPGTHLKAAPRSFARGSPTPEQTVVGFLATGRPRTYRIHGLGIWEKIVVDIPMQELG